MSDADGEAGVTTAETGRVSGALPRRQVALAFVCCLLLFGQPVVVVALAVSSPSVASLAVIVGGTVLLAAPAARAYVRQGWSVSRLADFVIGVGVTQLGLTLLSRAALAGTNGRLPAAGVQSGIVVVSYPLVYLVLTRGLPGRR